MNPDQVLRARAWRVGITKDQLIQMELEQKGLCAICEQPEKIGRALAIDHDHKTGRVRKLLCYRCNLLLGKADDDIEILQAAITYLQQHTTP